MHVVYVVNEDWMFWSHRRALARAAQNSGATVTVATRVGRLRADMEADGFRVVALPWRRGARSMIGEIRSLRALVRLYRQERPAIVHHVGIKSMLYGGVAACLGRRPRQIHALTGFGYVATSRQLRARVLRLFARLISHAILNNSRALVIVQNPDDQRAVCDAGWFDRGRVHLVRGSGVDVGEFVPLPEPARPFTVALAARLVRSKGVFDLVEASRELRARGRNDVHVILAGTCDVENPEGVDARALQEWVSEGLVEYAGHLDDIRELWRRAHVAVLPSYREGLPRALLEAAACARALIATDVPGCREIVRDGDNGLLVPARDPSALADAILCLCDDDAQRLTMARRSRERVEGEFSDAMVIGATFDVYRRLLASGGSV